MSDFKFYVIDIQGSIYRMVTRKKGDWDLGNSRIIHGYVTMYIKVWLCCKWSLKLRGRSLEHPLLGTLQSVCWTLATDLGRSSNTCLMSLRSLGSGWSIGNIMLWACFSVLTMYKSIQWGIFWLLCPGRYRYPSKPVRSCPSAIYRYGEIEYYSVQGGTLVVVEGG
jgi:hypothetical protein